MFSTHRSDVSAGRARMEGGQIIPLFAFCLVAMLAVAALLMDGGLAWANRRQAQSAASLPPRQ